MSEARSENDLILASKGSDREAFGELVKLHAEKIYNLCYRLSGNAEDAKDLAQDVFVNAFKGIGNFNQKAGISTWFHRIAVNLWINKSKRREIVKFVSIDKPVEYKDSEKSLHDVIPGGTTPHQDAEQKELEETMQKALGMLNDDQKTAIIMKYVEGKSLDEIAKICNCSIGTIGSRLSRGLQELEKHLKHLKMS